MTDIIQGWQCPVCMTVYAPHVLKCACCKPVTINDIKVAKWKFWPGWNSNHDRRIDDATCSNCGYEHPTVYGSVSKLNGVCPACACNMTPEIQDN